MILRTAIRKNYRIWFLPISEISSCGISHGKIISVNWLLCYRFFVASNIHNPGCGHIQLDIWHGHGLTSMSWGWGVCQFYVWTFSILPAGQHWPGSTPKGAPGSGIQFKMHKLIMQNPKLSKTKKQKMVPFQQTHGKSFAIPVFFKLLTVSCASM